MVDPASRNREIETGEDRRKGRRGTHSFVLSIEFTESCLQKKSPSLRPPRLCVCWMRFQLHGFGSKSLAQILTRCVSCRWAVTWRATARRAECCAGRCFKPNPCSWIGERARLGRNGTRHRVPFPRATSANYLVRSRALVFGARARRTTAGAAVLPTRFYCMDSAKRLSKPPDSRTYATCH